MCGCTGVPAGAEAMVETTETEVRFTTSNGESCAGVLERASASRGSGSGGAAAVLVHGGMAHKHALYHKPLSKALLASGRFDGVLRFDFPGNGESDDDHLGRFEFSRFMEDVGVLEDAVQLLPSSHGLRATLLVGHSRGAQICTWHAKLHGTVSDIALVCMRYDLSAWLKMCAHARLQAPPCTLRPPATLHPAAHRGVAWPPQVPDDAAR